MRDIRTPFHKAPQIEFPPARRSPRPPSLSEPGPAHLHLVEPRVLAGRYQLEGAIGKGSMGTVFRARDLRLGTLCAIKMLHQTALKEDADFQRFANEAAVIAHLFHPNIVEVSEFHRDERGGPFLVMELLHGFDLHSHLGHGRPLPLARVQLVIRQVASALHAAHSLGIVHRDIKPRNIFLAQHGGPSGAPTEVVKVVDFGLSKILGGRLHQTAPGEILGTPEYLAPEGTLGRSKLIDERTDQWALAITAYRMLAGQLPFQDDDVIRLMLKIRQEPLPPLAAFAVQVPEYVTAALGRALSKRKEDRFDSVLTFARALHGLPEGLRVEPHSSAIGLPGGTAGVGAEASRAEAGGAAAAGGPPRAPLPGGLPRPLLTAEQERQIELLETTQPIAPQVLDDLLEMSRSAVLRRTPVSGLQVLLAVCIALGLAAASAVFPTWRSVHAADLLPGSAPELRRASRLAGPPANVDPEPAAEPVAEPLPKPSAAPQPARSAEPSAPELQPPLARPGGRLGRRSLFRPPAEPGAFPRAAELR